MRAQKPEHLTLYDGCSNPVLRVSEPQARALLQAQLVTPIGRSRITALRLIPGTSTHEIKAQLRAGRSNTLPIAEDNITVRRVPVDGGITWAHCHVAAWSYAIR